MTPQIPLANDLIKQHEARLKWINKQEPAQ